jgi:mRNA deadenylase 3'-5' endonuclease subunit Ccr4
LIKTVGVQHDELVEQIGIKNGGEEFRRGNALLLLKLRHKETDREIILAQTHLHWNPKRDWVKQAQSANALYHMV